MQISMDKSNFKVPKAIILQVRKKVGSILLNKKCSLAFEQNCIKELANHFAKNSYRFVYDLNNNQGNVLAKIKFPYLEDLIEH